MNTAQDSTASGWSGGGGGVKAAIGDGECNISGHQESFIRDEQVRRRASMHADLKKEVERIARSGSPAAPMHLLTGDPYRRATEPVGRPATPSQDRTCKFNVPTRWQDQVSSKRKVSHVGDENLRPAERALSPEPRPIKPMFKTTEFRLTGARKSVSISGTPEMHMLSESFDHTRIATKSHGGSSPVRHGGGSPVRAENSNSSLGSGHRPASARTSGPLWGEDSSSPRSKSSLGFARANDRKSTPVNDARSQVDRLDMTNLRQLASSQTPEQLKQMVMRSIDDPKLDYGSYVTRSHNRSSVSGVFLAMKYSPAQLGVDGYGAPASLPEDLDELLNRPMQQKDATIKRVFHETLRSKTSSPSLKRSLKELPLNDGFINATSVKILKSSMTKGVQPFGSVKSPMVSKEDLMIEKAQNVMHDTPAYKKHACGFNMRGEMIVYSWASPHDFRGQYSNPRIHAPGKPPPPATSEKAKFKGFADDPVKMATLQENVKLDSFFHDPKGVLLCEPGGVGYFPIPAGAGRSTRAVKHKLQPAEAYHKYLNPDLLKIKKTHKADIAGEPELKFLRPPLIVDDRSKVRERECVCMRARVPACVERVWCIHASQHYMHADICTQLHTSIHTSIHTNTHTKPRLPWVKSHSRVSGRALLTYTPALSCLRTQDTDS